MLRSSRLSASGNRARRQIQAEHGDSFSVFCVFSGSGDGLILLLLTLVLGRTRGRLLCDHAAERAAEDDVSPRIVGDPMAHLVLELLVGERDSVPEIDEHVRNGSVSR